MNKRIDFSMLGGFPVTQYTLDYLQDSYRGLFMALAALIGDKVVVSGMEEVGGQCTNGWLSYNGELVPFVGAPLGDSVIIQETIETRLFFDAQSKAAYYKREATFGTGPGSFPYTDITRIGTLKDLWYGMAPKGALMYYEGLTEDLPAGWEVHLLSKGRFLVGFNEGDADFGVMGKDGIEGRGGSKSKSVSVMNLAPFTVDVPIPPGKTSQTQDGTGRIVGGNQGNEPGALSTLTSNPIGGNQQLGVLNPYYVAAIIKKVI